MQPWPARVWGMWDDDPMTVQASRAGPLLKLSGMDRLEAADVMPGSVAWQRPGSAWYVALPPPPARHCVSEVVPALGIRPPGHRSAVALRHLEPVWVGGRNLPLARAVPRGSAELQAVVSIIHRNLRVRFLSLAPVGAVFCPRAPGDKESQAPHPQTIAFVSVRSNP